MKPKGSRRERAIINIRMEINEIKKGRTIEKIIEANSWFFQKMINKTDKLSGKKEKRHKLLTSAGRERQHHYRFSMYWKANTIIHEQSYDNKLKNQDGQIPSLKDKLPKITQKNLNSPLSMKYIEFAVKNSPPQKQNSSPNGFTNEFYQTYKEEILLHNFFQKTHSMRPLPWYSDTKTMKAQISLINRDVDPWTTWIWTLWVYLYAYFFSINTMQYCNCIFSPLWFS